MLRARTAGFAVLPWSPGRSAAGYRPDRPGDRALHLARWRRSDGRGDRPAAASRARAGTSFVLMAIALGLLGAVFT